MTKEMFIEALKELQVEVTDKMLDKLDVYYEMLVEYNKNINLTGITDYSQVYLKHFYDSLTLVKACSLTNNLSLCDIGTGAGFPGLVLKIVFPNLEVTLVDSLNKRTLFLQDVIDKLELTNIYVVTARAEEYALTCRDKFDIVTARAVSKLNILLEYCIPLLKVKGLFIPLKGSVTEEELKLTNALSKLKVSLENKISFLLPIEESHRTILVFKKNEVTPLLYPRKFDKIKKQPL